MSYLVDPDNWEWVVTGNNFRFIFEGFLTNVEIALICMVFSLVVGLGLALARLSRNRLVSVVSGAWIDVFRNLPLIFLILFLALQLPNSWKNAWADNVPDWLPEAFRFPLMPAALIGLVLYNSAVIAEIMRSGILSLARGQGEAAAALGMSYRQSMAYVILPQGLRRMVPATVSQLITLNKDTTLVSIIAITEGLRKSRIVSNTAGNPFAGGGDVKAPILQVLIVLALLFILVNLALSRLSTRLEIRERKRTGTTVKPVKGLEDHLAVESLQINRGF